MSETETEIGWRIARGELPSPQRLPGFALFALRFSGTGTAWREAHQEHVVRPPAEYLSPEMRSQIAGVPVVTLHPENGNLDSVTYAQTVIGAICFGYVAGADGILSDTGDELWCIARIGDDAAADAMATGQFSTSPAVVFAADSGNATLGLQDGTQILFEGRPAVIDHLAAGINAGVWDRGGPPTGIRTDSAQEQNMDDPVQDNRTDAHPGIEPDKLLTTLDAISKRLDAIEKGGHRTNDDPERAEWLREDSAACARDDAEEARETERLEREEGKSKEVAADAARKARRDRWQARKDMQRRHDSVALTTAQAAAARETENANYDVQARADSVARAWGMTAPPPMQGEATLAYRVRLARHYQQYCTEPSFKSLDLGALAAVQPAAMDGIERKIYADSLAASANPVGEDDRLVRRTRTNPDTGHRITEFHGRRTFIWHLKRPSMRATAFMVPNNRAA